MNLRIGHLSTIYHTALILQGLRMLKKTGLHVTWRLYGGGPGIVEAMDRGEVDIGYVGLPPVMTGVDRGVPIKCVAGGHIEGTALCTMDKPSGETEEEVVKGLEGLRIGSPPTGSIHDILIRHFLKKHGVRASVVNYPWSDFITLSLEKSEVDAAIGTPALAVYLKRELGAWIALPPNKTWPFNPSYGIIARDEILDEEALRTFLKAHEKASNILIRSPEKAAMVAAGVLGFADTGFALEAIRLSPHYCASLPRGYIDSTMAFTPVMIDLGYLSKPLKETDVFHTALIEKIHPGPDHYNKPLRR